MYLLAKNVFLYPGVGEIQLLYKFVIPCYPPIFRGTKKKLRPTTGNVSVKRTGQPANFYKASNFYPGSLKQNGSPVGCRESWRKYGQVWWVTRTERNLDMRHQLLTCFGLRASSAWVGNHFPVVTTGFLPIFVLWDPE